MKITDLIHVPSGKVSVGIPPSRYSAVANKLLELSRADTVGSHSKPSCEQDFLEYVKQFKARSLQVSEFLIDRKPVSVLHYKKFVEEMLQLSIARPNRDNLRRMLTYDESSSEVDPVSGVTWAGASLYCSCHGGRLPSAIEYLRCIRPPRFYPDLDLPQLLPGQLGLSSWVGCLGICGAICEWTSTPIVESRAREWAEARDYYFIPDFRERLSFVDLPTGEARSWMAPDRRSLCYTVYKGIGFRCAYPF